MLSVILNPSSRDAKRHPFDGTGTPDAPILLWIDEDVKGILKKLHRRYAKRAIMAFAGRTRNVFEMPGGYVVKLPKNFDGMADNDWEGSVSNSEEGFDNPDYVQYARTRLSYHGEIPVVFMERVRPLTGGEIRARFGAEPDWTMSVDGGQVGVNRRGRLVAYDYGIK